LKTGNRLEEKTPRTGIIRISEVVKQIWKAMNERYEVTARPSWKKILWGEENQKTKWGYPRDNKTPRKETFDFSRSSGYPIHKH